MKEFTNVAGNVTSFAGNVSFFFLAGYYAHGRDLKGFGNHFHLPYTTSNLPKYRRDTSALFLQKYKRYTGENTF